MRPKRQGTHCGCSSPLFSVQHVGDTQKYLECNRCGYRVPLPVLRSPFSEPVEYRFTVPPDCFDEVKHVLLAGAGHAYCWKCGIAITEQSSTPNPSWPIGRAVQRLMASSLQLLPHVNTYAHHNTQGSVHGHIQEIKEAIYEIERITGIHP